MTNMMAVSLEVFRGKMVAKTLVYIRRVLDY